MSGRSTRLTAETSTVIGGALLGAEDALRAMNWTIAHAGNFYTALDAGKFTTYTGLVCFQPARDAPLPWRGHVHRFMTRRFGNTLGRARPPRPCLGFLFHSDNRELARL